MATCLLSLAGCKPSEASYRRAYERTIAADSTHTPFDETIYGNFRRQVRSIDIIADGDTVPSKIINVFPAKVDGVFPEMMKRYCVCVAGFKQIFNAQSLTERMRGGGWPGAFPVATPEPYYYVIAASYADAQEAIDALQQLRKTSPVTLGDGMPFILQPARLAR